VDAEFYVKGAHFLDEEYNILSYRAATGGGIPVSIGELDSKGCKLSEPTLVI